MIRQSHFAQPPSVAVWLISMFGASKEGESILGDLVEEFSVLASKSGVTFARNWFWRQTIKTLPHLARFGFGAAPWKTTAALVGGYLLRKLVGPLVGKVTFAMLERFQAFFGHHTSVYLFFASTGIDIEHLVSFLLIGIVIAFAAKENEMLTTTTLALIFAGIAVVGSTYAAIRSGNVVLLWRLTWYFADSLAIVVGGAIVRMRRLAARSGSAGA